MIVGNIADLDASLFAPTRDAHPSDGRKPSSLSLKHGIYFLRSYYCSIINIPFSSSPEPAIGLGLASSLVRHSSSDIYSVFPRHTEWGDSRSSVVSGLGMINTLISIYRFGEFPVFIGLNSCGIEIYDCLRLNLAFCTMFDRGTKWII